VKTLRAPFPYYGYKGKVSAEVWSRLGNPPNYVEPFFGSGAVLLQRPQPGKREVVNDKYGALVNFWRSVKANPALVAAHAVTIGAESELHARNAAVREALDELTACHLCAARLNDSATRAAVAIKTTYLETIMDKTSAAWVQDQLMAWSELDDENKRLRAENERLQSEHNASKDLLRGIGVRIEKALKYGPGIRNIDRGRLGRAATVIREYLANLGEVCDE
jgi:hypothetical protein